MAHRIPSRSTFPSNYFAPFLHTFFVLLAEDLFLMPTLAMTTRNQKQNAGPIFIRTLSTKSS